MQAIGSAPASADAGRSSISTFIRSHAVAIYFVLAFAISWGGVLMVVVPSGIPATTEEFRRLFPLALVAMLAGPSVAGILLTGLVHGRPGFRALRARLLKWRVGARWYAIALLMSPVATTALLLILSLFTPDFLPGIFTATDRSALLILGTSAALGAGFFEELGWTGFAIPAMRLRRSVLATGLVVGVLWGAWHLLATYWGSGTSSGALSLGIFLPALVSALGGLATFRLLMVWVYDRTESLLVAMLMHASLTATALILQPAATGTLLLIYALLSAAMWAVFAAIGMRRSPTPSTAPRVSASPRLRVDGHVSPGFEPVRDAFVENFTRRHELGGACCVYHHGEKVVDLWGGVRNKATGEPWESDTMVVVHSATKGMAAMTLAVAHSRGWLDYEERVCTYWPEFAQNGKERITVRQLLAHQAGLFAFDEPVDRSVVADLDRLAVVLARQKPAWEPGTRQAYHALTLGFHEGELLRRVDPRHRSLGRFFQDEIAAPLGIDFYIRLPRSIPDSRLATLATPSPIAMILGFPLRLTLDAFNRRSNIYRALVVNPGSSVYLDEERIYARDLEVPSGGGVGTARAIARAYGVFAGDGRELRLRPETLHALAAPAVPAGHGFHDEGLKGEIRFSLGFMKPSPDWPFGSESSFGSPGSGGSLGFADPETGIGYGYVTSQMGTTLTGDPRDIALRDAVYAIVARHEPTDRPTLARAGTAGTESGTNSRY